MKSAFDCPRILYIAEACALQSSNGSHQRYRNIVRALQQIGNVEIMALGHSDNLTGTGLQVSSDITVADTLTTEPRPNNGLFAKLRWTFDPTTDYPAGRGVVGEQLCRLLRSTQEFDVIWFFKQHCVGLLPTLAWERSVLDVDDVLSRYERAVLNAGGGPLERVLTLHRLLSWRRRERYLGTRFSVLSVCSEDDRQYLDGLGIHVPIHVIPNGFERPAQEPARCPAIPPRIGFIGFLDYFPNLQGIRWFVTRCWPQIKRDIPGVRLRLVGKGTDGPLKPPGPDIDGLGWLANPNDEMQTWSVMAVPIQIGAGTRVKIVHGFSRKCPIVSTSLGAYGYGTLNGRELYLADSPQGFAQACISAIREPAKAEQMATRAWRTFLDTWTPDAVHRRVCAAVEDCLRSHTRYQSAVNPA